MYFLLRTGKENHLNKNLFDLIEIFYEDFKSKADENNSRSALWK